MSLYVKFRIIKRTERNHNRELTKFYVLQKCEHDGINEQSWKDICKNVAYDKTLTEYNYAIDIAKNKCMYEVVEESENITIN